MNIELARQLGFLGVNVDQNFGIDWLKTEVVNKAEQGDVNSLYKLYNIARHYTGDNEKEIKQSASEAIARVEKSFDEKTIKKVDEETKKA